MKDSKNKKNEEIKEFKSKTDQKEVKSDNKNSLNKAKPKKQSLIAKRILEQRRIKEERERKFREEEEERIRKEEEREKAIRLEEEKRIAIKEKKKEARKEKIEKAKRDKTYKTPSQRKKQQAAEKARILFEQNNNFLKLSSNNNKTKRKNKQKKQIKKVIKDNGNLITQSSIDKSNDTVKTNDKQENNLEEGKDNNISDLDDWDEDTDESIENVVIDNKTTDTISKSQNKEKLTPKIEHPANISKNNSQELKSPICCVLGHVDTGKTKLLDRIRKTSVQSSESGGITQQIGASFFPMDTIKKITKSINISMKKKLKYKIPGLLVIDTPGHESFINLRKRGSVLCDIAILVVDIMHGIEPQTKESFTLLKKKKTPFIIALNKIDKIYGWKANKDFSFSKSITKQNQSQVTEFKSKLKQIIMEFNSLGLNCSLYSKNKDFQNIVSICPTSAITGEGIPDLLMLVVQLTQKFMTKRIKYSDKVEGSVLEVRISEGLGVTIDVILFNGILKTGQSIILCGLNGPIITTIKILYTPSPLKEIRHQGGFKKINSIKASAGVKIAAYNLEEVVSGSPLYVIRDGDNVESLKELVMSDLKNISRSLHKSGKGVYVTASTLGSLEALLIFLEKEKIPVSMVSIGTLYKKDIMRASTILERSPEFACVLAFNVNIDKEAEALATKINLKIFRSEIIYHLFDNFTEHLKKYREQKKNEAPEAIFPVLMSILPEHIIRKHDPIILGCKVEDGKLKIGTPLCALLENIKTEVSSSRDRNNYFIMGKVGSIELNGNSVQEANIGEKVSVKINQGIHENHIYYGRQFDYRNKLCSLISRGSIDVLKEHCMEQLTKRDGLLLKKLKKVFDII